MQRFASLIDLIHFNGPTLQDYATAEELDQLIDGTLPHAAIADRYIADFGQQVTESAEASRADLLTWIPMEIECAIQQRRDADRDEAAMTKLHELKAHAAADDRHERISRAYKLTLIEQARENGAQKNAIADALGISRPTLDKWLQEQDDRALFNDALYLLSKADMRPEDREAAYMALGIRDTNQQAHVVFDLTKYGTDHLTTVQRDRVLQAEQRAQAML